MSVFYDLSKTPRNILNQAIVRAIVSENNGALFDPSDMSTLYQDAAGTIPVTAVEQPVGLMLDKSRGMMLGPELVSNGMFDSGTEGWVSSAAYPATITETGGVCSFTSLYTNARIRPPEITTNIGAMYTVTITILSLATTVIVRPSIDSNQGVSGTSLGDLIIDSVGTYTFMFKARTTTTYLWVINNGAIGTVVSLDNISVRELYGYHATQSITASRPVISARKNLLLTTDALSTQRVTTVAAQQTLSFTGTGSVTLSGTATGTLAGTGVNNRVSLTFTPTAGTLMLTVSGDVRLGQLEYGPTATRYQKVNTSTDYDTAGFPRYLQFDNVDDYLNLPYMGLYANGSASVIAALSNLNNKTNESLVCEANNASVSQIYLPMTTISGSTYGAYIRNDQDAELLKYLPVESYISPALIKAHVDTGSEFKMHRNSIGMTAVSYVRWGTLSHNIATIGCAKQTSTFNFFGGRLYGLILTKSDLSDSDRRKCEVYLSRKAGVIL